MVEIKSKKCDFCGGDCSTIDNETYKCDYCGKLFKKVEVYSESKEYTNLKVGDDYFQKKYEYAVELLNGAKTIQAYNRCKEIFNECKDKYSVNSYIELCNEKISELEKQQLYDEACNYLKYENIYYLNLAKDSFEKLNEFKDSKLKIEECLSKITEVKIKEKELIKIDNQRRTKRRKKWLLILIIISFFFVGKFTLNKINYNINKININYIEKINEESNDNLGYYKVKFKLKVNNNSNTAIRWVEGNIDLEDKSGNHIGKYSFNLNGQIDKNDYSDFTLTLTVYESDFSNFNDYAFLWNNDLNNLKIKTKITKIVFNNGKTVTDD